MIKVFSSPNCYHCTELKQQLIDKGVDFEFMDLDDDKVMDEARELCEKTGNTELPVVVTNSGKVLNRPELKDLI
jgi:glutaredoxin